VLKHFTTYCNIRKPNIYFTDFICVTWFLQYTMIISPIKHGICNERFLWVANSVINDRHFFFIKFLLLRLNTDDWYSFLWKSVVYDIRVMLQSFVLIRINWQYGPYKGFTAYRKKPLSLTHCCKILCCFYFCRSCVKSLLGLTIYNIKIF
jgi:hypothetical protein